MIMGYMQFGRTDSSHLYLLLAYLLSSDGSSGFLDTRLADTSGIENRPFRRERLSRRLQLGGAGLYDHPVTRHLGTRVSKRALTLRLQNHLALLLVD